MKEGYKKTEVGLIPKSWKLKSFQDYADSSIKWSITGGPFGSNLKVEDYTEEGVRIIQLQNIGDGVFRNDYKIFTSNKKADELLSCNIYPNEIILSKMGDPVARACFMPNRDERYLMASDGIRLVVDEDNFNKKYVHDYINSTHFRKIAIAVSTGSTRQRISLPALKKIKIIQPPLPEQKAIANCLTTWDSGIEKLSALIKAKKEQKKGLMQQLLTGKMRLDGFEEEWEYKRISDISEIVGGGTPSTTNPNYWNGEISWFTPTEIKKKFVGKSARRITEKGLKNSSAKLLPPGTILLTTRATIGEASIAKIECSTNQGFQSIVCTPGKANNLFLYDFIKFNKKEFIRKANGSTFLEVSKKEIQKIQFKIPCYEEQTAIANVLTTADKQIALLEKKLEGFKEQKRGLMQVLLTGERRLIEN